MMDVNKVQILVQEGEGLTVEYKERYTPRIDRDIVAFANSKGGILLLGVDDAGRVVGEKLTNKMKAEINAIARNCDPRYSLKAGKEAGKKTVEKGLVEKYGENTEQVRRKCGENYFGYCRQSVY